MNIARHAAARGATVQAARGTFRDVFIVPEFRALWLAQLLSVVGDQLARVALTVLVYDRTRSAFLAAVTFVASVVPTFIGGVALSGLADRFPRRQVMIVCDLVRCVLVLIMAIPGMPLAPMVVLLFLVTLVGAPFTSARAAIYPDVLTGDSYVMGTAVTLTTNQFAQVIGFATGGAIVGFFGTRPSLVIDAATFAVSAVIVRAWVRYRPAATPAAGTPRPARSGLLAAIRLVFGNPALRIPLLFGWLMAFYDAPEGVSAPLGHSLGGGAATVGLLLAAQTFGSSVGSLAFARMVDPAWQRRLMGPLAVAACAVLVLFASSPRLPGALVILAVSGFLTCYQLAANAAFVMAAPEQQRSQAFGLAQAGMSLGQGTMMLLAGAAAERFAPATVVAACGVAGAVVAAGIAASRSARRATAEPPFSSVLVAPAAGAHAVLLPGGGAVVSALVVDSGCQPQPPVRMPCSFLGVVPSWVRWWWIAGVSPSRRCACRCSSSRVVSSAHKDHLY